MTDWTLASIIIFYGIFTWYIDTFINKPAKHMFGSKPNKKCNLILKPVRKNYKIWED